MNEPAGPRRLWVARTNCPTCSWGLMPDEYLALRTAVRRGATPSRQRPPGPFPPAHGCTRAGSSRDLSGDRSDIDAGADQLRGREVPQIM
jgi:hypothetical protein